ncbi:cellulase family glycosylhydrolase [Streptomyces sp. MNU76]|uniref:cellulase family glycosylhydrolase n=1 Tax=Streptomyces sp. MNU76 TaxID=2560026 RepID=UPI001E483C85|nr:cellulase family glycosylhydrolase [Streptomyces sp. MNU76]MCC9708034.1 cellulase family glycosylhydrolase [Streptomyces sp. MNU76]
MTRALFQKIGPQGFKSIRLPVTWGIHQGAAPGYTIDPAWMAKVRQVVDLALDENLYVLLNMHHDSWMWVNTLPKQWDTAFTAYTDDAIKLTAEFVTSLREGARVTLIFHFWSGAKATYHVTKSGDTVTGSPA